jgi:hypothetical protein
MVDIGLGTGAGCQCASSAHCTQQSPSTIASPPAPPQPTRTAAAHCTLQPSQRMALLRSGPRLAGGLRAGDAAARAPACCRRWSPTHAPRDIRARATMEEAFQAAYTMSQLYVQSRPEPIPLSEHEARRKRKDMAEIVEVGPWASRQPRPAAGPTAAPALQPGAPAHQPPAPLSLRRPPGARASRRRR